MFALFFYFIENVMDIFEEKCWLTKIGRGSFWTFGVCVYCAMVTRRSVFLYMMTGAVSDEWCVFKVIFLYFPFCKFLFVIIVTSL